MSVYAYNSSSCTVLLMTSLHRLLVCVPVMGKQMFHNLKWDVVHLERSFANVVDKMVEILHWDRIFKCSKAIFNLIQPSIHFFTCLNKDFGYRFGGRQVFSF